MPLKDKGSETHLGGVIIEYDPAAGPTSFMIGTEQVGNETIVTMYCLFSA
jgi:hypothetical protein